MKADQIGKRIKEVRKDQRMTQTEFGVQIGVKGNTITGYENGTRSPSDAVINNICLVFSVNQTWLRTGDGEKYIAAPDSASVLEKLFCDHKCNNLEIEFLNAYFGLKKQERKAFCELLVKMFPDAMSRIVGGDPLGSPYEVVFQEAPPLSEDVDGDEEDYANLARQQRLSEKEQAAQASSVKESDVG